MAKRIEEMCIGEEAERPRGRRQQIVGNGVWRVRPAAGRLPLVGWQQKGYEWKGIGWNEEGKDVTKRKMRIHNSPPI
jgi:hypothetical protein